MILEKERIVVADAGRELLSSRLTVATGGNVSLCNREAGLIAITPSGMDYKRLKPDDVCVVDLEGEQVDGRRVPSSETPMHSMILRERSEYNALAHTHSPYCTAFSMLGEPIPAVHYLMPLMGNEIPVADYATYGTEAMGPAIIRVMEFANTVLIRSHGLMAAAKTLNDAVNLSRIAEYIAHSYYLARSLGEPEVLPPEELDNLRSQFAKYGQVGKPP